MRILFLMLCLFLIGCELQPAQVENSFKVVEEGSREDSQEIITVKGAPDEFEAVPVIKDGLIEKGEMDWNWIQTPTQISISKQYYKSVKSVTETETEIILTLEPKDGVR